MSHVRRMSSLLQNNVLFDQLSEARRHRERPILRYKDVCKEDFSIYSNYWEKMSVIGRTVIHVGDRVKSPDRSTGLQMKASQN